MCVLTYVCYLMCACCLQVHICENAISINYVCVCGVIECAVSCGECLRSYSIHVLGMSALISYCVRP